jgi:hypothetical protein
MIDVRAFDGDPMVWANSVAFAAEDIGVRVYFDSYGQYITAKSRGWKRERFPAPCFTDIGTVKAVLTGYAT